MLLAGLLTGCGSGGDPELLRSEILVSSDQTGNWEIFIFDPKSSIAHQVTREAGYEPEFGAEVSGFDFEAAWSPDGQQIVLVTDRYATQELLVVDRAGSEIQRFDEMVGAGEPAWSPDGTQIAFRSDTSWDPELYVMDATGSNVRQLTHSPGEDWTPTWSPDGTRLAFSSRRGNGSWDIFTMRPDGSEVAQLTFDSWDNYLPDWSPDGHRIAFASDRSGNWDIFTMDPDGSSVQQLTDHEDSDIEPVWSPDGSQLAFATLRNRSMRGWEVFLVDLDGGRESGTGQQGYPTDWFAESENSR
jgi:TolB protein